MMAACAVETCSCFGFTIINVVYRRITPLLLRIAALCPDCKRIGNVVCLSANIFLSCVFSYASQGYRANSASQCIVTHTSCISCSCTIISLSSGNYSRKESKKDVFHPTHVRQPRPAASQTFSQSTSPSILNLKECHPCCVYQSYSRSMIKE